MNFYISYTLINLGNTMDASLIIAISGATFTIIAIMFSLIFWIRMEANEIRKEKKENRKDILNLVREIESEIKDFHHRLIDIEKSRK